MFTKIIKRGTRKHAKSDTNESAFYPYGSSVHRNSGSVSTSYITVNHASRTAVPSPRESPTAVSSPPTPTFISDPVVECLPFFRDVAVSARSALFIRKLHLCCILFDFSDSLKSASEKETKRQTLLELIEFLQSSSSELSEHAQEELVRTISMNIFRCLPPSSHENTGPGNMETEEDETYLDPAWSHLHLIYELLLRYVVSSDTSTKIAKRYIDHSFVFNLLDLFDSEDPREREYLKTILHRIYGKFMVHRPFIRKAINNIFYRFIFETERHSGIGELLEILGSIINGFALPMKEEHRLFLVRALIPLHKPKPIGIYHHQLSYCITQYVEKDCKLAGTVIRGLLKYWPLTNCSKEVLFLQELEEVLEATESEEFQRCMVPLFKQIRRCLNSPHFQVAERAFFFWNNDHIVHLIAQNRAVILPIIFEALEKNMDGHWNQAIHGLTANVRRLFFEMDDELFGECQLQYSDKMARAEDIEDRRRLTWRRLEAVAAAKDGSDDSIMVR